MPETFDEVNEQWLAIETECELFDIRVDGVPVWERVRRNLYGKLLRKSGQFPDEMPSASIPVREYLTGIGLWLRNAVDRNPFFAPQRDVLVWGHERRKLLDDGYWWDIYCDPLYENLDIDALHLEEPFKNSHRKPARTERLRYLDLIEYTGTFQRKAGVTNTGIPQRAEEKFRKAELEFEKRIGVTPDVVKQIRHVVAVRRSTKWLYERLLDRIEPELVLVLISYDRETFVEVCQSRGIPVVELQHGIIHEYHPGYHYPGERTKEAFPDFFFSFGDFWNDQAAFPIDDDRVISVGYPFLEWQQERYSSRSTRDQVVFVSQQSIGVSLSKLAVEVSEQIPHDVVYKIHPGAYDTWKARYPWLTDADVRVVASDDPSLYQLFADSTIQVGVGSTALYEGLQFELATYIADLPSSEYTRPLVEEGYASIITNAEELVAAISSDEQQPVDATHVFAENALENFEREFEKLHQQV